MLPGLSDYLDLYGAPDPARGRLEPPTPQPPQTHAEAFPGRPAPESPSLDGDNDLHPELIRYLMGRR